MLASASHINTDIDTSRDIWSDRVHSWPRYANVCVKCFSQFGQLALLSTELDRLNSWYFALRVSFFKVIARYARYGLIELATLR